jgi:hypothetical protein
MTKFHEKVEGRTKQIFGEMISDGRLVRGQRTSSQG